MYKMHIEFFSSTILMILYVITVIVNNMYDYEIFVNSELMILELPPI